MVPLKPLGGEMQADRRGNARACLHPSRNSRLRPSTGSACDGNARCPNSPGLRLKSALSGKTMDKRERSAGRTKKTRHINQDDNLGFTTSMYKRFSSPRCWVATSIWRAGSARTCELYDNASRDWTAVVFGICTRATFFYTSASWESRNRPLEC